MKTLAVLLLMTFAAVASDEKPKGDAPKPGQSILLPSEQEEMMKLFVLAQFNEINALKALIDGKLSVELQNVAKKASADYDELHKMLVTSHGAKGCTWNLIQKQWICPLQTQADLKATEPKK